MSSIDLWSKRSSTLENCRCLLKTSTNLSTKWTCVCGLGFAPVNRTTAEISLLCFHGFRHPLKSLFAPINRTTAEISLLCFHGIRHPLTSLCRVVWGNISLMFSWLQASTNFAVPCGLGFAPINRTTAEISLLCFHGFRHPLTSLINPNIEFSFTSLSYVQNRKSEAIPHLTQEKWIHACLKDSKIGGDEERRS
ncbi:hypothetical protein J6590_085522 [Homalodisca vitripennis]|nr:hypothetical protein J6590_085522 [Homalodisca vitripennis]